MPASVLSVILHVVVVDQLDSLRSESVRLRMARHIRIKHNVLRVRDTVDWPSGDTTVLALPAVRVEIVYEACPGVAHQITELRVALALVFKGIDCVAQSCIMSADRSGDLDLASLTIEIIEHPRNFLEMRDFIRPRHSGWDSIEAVTIGRDVRRSPCLAGQTTVCNEDLVTKVCCAVTIVGTEI